MTRQKLLKQPKAGTYAENALCEDVYQIFQTCQ